MIMRSTLCAGLVLLVACGETAEVDAGSLQRGDAGTDGGAAATDGGVAASREDSGAADGGAGDGGASDSGAEGDAGAIDAGAIDAGAIDAGGADAGPLDAGVCMATVHPADPYYDRFEGTAFTNECGNTDDCTVGGCSAEVCAGEAIATTCEGLPYHPTGTCQCNAGVCQWATGACGP